MQHKYPCGLEVNFLLTINSIFFLLLCLSFRLFHFRVKSFGKLCIVHMFEIIHLCLKIYSAHFTLPSAWELTCITLHQQNSQGLVFCLGSNHVEHHQKLEKEDSEEWGVFIPFTLSACLPWAVCHLPTKFTDPFSMDDLMKFSPFSSSS